MFPYLPSVDWYATYIAQGSVDGGISAVASSRYTRQMDINRCRILMPDGPQTLTIPLIAASTHGPLDDIIISDHGRWRSHHWNALQTAYGKSPFFEYYADDFRPFFTNRSWPRLADFNSALHGTVCRLIDINLPPHKSPLPKSIPSPEAPLSPEATPSLKSSPHISPLVAYAAVSQQPQPPRPFPRPIPSSPPSPLPPPHPLPPYYQVFAQRLGFQPNMSIVDLLFNMGPESILVLLGK